jgi:hypothetical protein
MKNHLVILVLVIFLFGCVPVTPIPTSTPMPTVRPATSTLRATIIPTAILPTDTSTLTPTPDISPISAPTMPYNKNMGVEAKCVEVNQNVQTGNLGTGMVVLENRGNGLNGRHQPGLYFLDMETGLLNNPFGTDRYASVGSVSPDRKLLVAWADGLGGIIMTADGKVLGKLQAQSNGDSDWLNNHQLITIEYQTNTNPNKIKAFEADPRLVLNPFTGEQRLLHPDFPDIYNNCCHQPSWGGIVYNPLLTRAVYLAMPGTIFVLWDLQKKKPLLSWTQFFNAEQNIPRWSPDGSKFAFYGILGKLSTMPEGPSLPYKLYLADNNGNYSELVPDNKNLPIYDYFWSPSGRYLAFIWQVISTASHSYDNDRLLVLDTQTKKITDYCVEFRPSGFEKTPVVWSPDETQILLEDKYTEDPRHWRVILVDLVKGTAFPIAEDMIASGWMKSP